ncbi:putative lysosomal cystine transporter [Rosellinia necatrix]|uniref:Putative lysosomal cystine transporter n=1 Tax=Rosellinia necatrix TaxID=77044 RepID=A0A1S7UNU5_ROSNE|nr:putative lysosomal cystine transporter [Rosellinia necatrix]
MNSLEFLSALFGWVYTICWSLSFYPQAFLNFRRKSTGGTTVDFPFLNALGFASYFIYTCALHWSPLIRHQYALRHDSHTPTVAFNDIIFALHAFILTVILNTQYFMPLLWGFELSTGRKPSRFITGVFAGCITGILLIIFVVASQSPDADPRTSWAWLDVIYVISYVKLLVTVVKYVPQLVHNTRNRSTKGWDISQILLDFTGGILSLAQLGIDSYLQHDWSGITGNPVKFFLGNVSMLYDLLFMGQHYCLYREDSSKPNRERERLLETGEGHARLD